MEVSPLPPGPKGHLLLGSLPEIRKEELDFLIRCVREYGDVVHVRVVNHDAYIVSHPRDIESVLLTNYNNFIKSVFLRESRALLGNGLLTSDGGFWLRQRRLLQPAFHMNQVAAYSRTIVEHSQRELERWRDGEVRDIHADMTRMTMEIISTVLFGDDIGAHTDRAGEALRVFFDQFDDRFGLYAIPEWLPTPGNIRYRRAIHRLDEILEEVINRRRGAHSDGGLDVLSTLLRVQDEDGTALTNTQLRDEMMTLFFTGHETTALGLAWTWYLLAQNPEADSQLFDEVQRVLGGRTPTFRDIPHLTFIDKVVKESLRLYPPAYGVVREALADCELGGYTIPKGSTVAIFQYSVHRDPRYFDRPEEFRPERWTEEFTSSLPRGAYFPFGLGPRVCIGNTFALTEMALSLAVIAQRFRFEPAPGHRAILSPSLTLRPYKGIKLIARERERRASVN